MEEYKDLARRVRDVVHDQIVDRDFRGYTNASVTRVESHDRTVRVLVEVWVTLYAQVKDE